MNDGLESQFAEVLLEIEGQGLFHLGGHRERDGCEGE